MLVYLIVIIGLAAWISSRAGRARGAGDGWVPPYHGAYVALWVGVPAVLLLLGGLALRGTVLDALVVARFAPTISPGPSELFVAEVHALAAGIGVASPGGAVADAATTYVRWRGFADLAILGLCAVAMVGALVFAKGRLVAGFPARRRVERVLSGLMIACAVFALLTMVGMVMTLIRESMTFFQDVRPGDFLLGSRWGPQIAIRGDQIGDVGSFGALPVLVGTMLVAGLAMILAVPVGLLGAIHLSEYAGERTRGWARPTLAVLSSLPTVVHGFLAIVTVAPAVHAIGTTLGIATSINSALAAGLVTGLMIVPTLCALGDDALRAVPRSLREGSLAVGATTAETTRHVIVPAARAGLVGAVLVALSRAIGETMIVLMAGGLVASLSIDPLGPTTTTTAQIVTLLIGDTTFDNPKTLAAFALGLVLLLATFALNALAFSIARSMAAHRD